MHSSHQTPRSVWVGMSGGVDSSLAAALLVESGYACTGVTMDLGRGEADRSSIEPAATVCEHLGISHRVVDFAEVFHAAVVDATARAYAHGLTPNPCVICNVEIKFGALHRSARAAGAVLATGHYVRIVGESPHVHLARAIDTVKDQSYFLYRVASEVLQSLIFPLGSLTKREVRALAATRGLDVLHAPESQDACFLGAGGYPALVRELYPEACLPGPVVAADGTVLGVHDGMCRFTVGQRKGLGIASAEALYVTGIDASENAVIVGPHGALETVALKVIDAVWSGGGDPVECEVKVRYNSPSVRSLVTPVDRELVVVFAEPIFGAAPGQSAVCYQGDVVIGGGIIGEAS